MAFISSQCTSLLDRPSDTQLLNNLSVNCSKKPWLAQVQTQLNKKICQPSDITDALAITVDTASTVDQMKNLLGMLSPPERETVALCALLRTGMDSNAAGTDKLSILSEALKEYDIDLRAVALNQVIKGWPLQKEPQSKMNHSEADSDKIRHFAELSPETLPNSMSVLTWGMRASYLMNQLIVDSYTEDLAPLNQGAEAGLRRAISATNRNLPEEIVFGVPLFGTDILGGVHKDDLFENFQNIVETRACFELVQMGLRSALKELLCNSELDENSFSQKIYPLIQSIRRDNWPQGALDHYLGAIEPLLQVKSLEFDPAIKDELVSSVLLPFSCKFGGAVTGIAERIVDLDTEKAFVTSLKHFLGRLKDSEIIKEKSHLHTNQPDALQDYVQRTLEEAGIDLALYDLFNQPYLDSIEDFFSEDINDVLRSIETVLAEERNNSVSTALVVEPVVYQNVRIQLGICLAEILLRQEGRKFNRALILELQKEILRLDEDNEINVPSTEKYLILYRNSSIRTKLLEKMKAEKPTCNDIIDRTIRIMSNEFHFAQNLTSLDESKLRNTLLSILHQKFQSHLDNSCLAIQLHINYDLNFKSLAQSLSDETNIFAEDDW